MTLEQWISIYKAANEYAQNVLKLLKNYDLRGLVDNRNEKIGKKIRDSELKKIPYMLIVGENEFNNESVSVRKQGKEDLGEMKLKDFALYIDKKINKNKEYSIN